MSNPNDGFTFEIPGLGVKMKSRPKPQQLEVPGFGEFFKSCKRDHAQLQGKRSGRPLPLFDSLTDTPQTDSAPLSLPHRRLSGDR